MMTIPEFNDVLKKHKGWRSSLRDFSPTHSRFVFELNDPSSERCVYLLLLGCTRINAPTGWEVTNPSVRNEPPQRQGDPPGFVFTDEGVRVEFVWGYQLDEEYES